MQALATARCVVTLASRESRISSELRERDRDMALGVRRSITDLQKDYDSGNKTALENLMRAWKGFKELPPPDPNSFFVIGGYHGEPFRGQGETNPAWWGGYCQHGTVLFPSWHRAYLFRLEQALQSIPGCA